MLFRPLIVQTTFTDREEAEAFAEKVVNSRLAACVQLSSEVTSYYRWDGEVQKDKEIVVTMKTREDLFAQLEFFISQLHSYETPEILALPVVHAAKDYLNWMADEVEGDGQ